MSQPPEARRGGGGAAAAEVLDVSSGDEDAPTDPASPPRRFHEYRRGRELGRGASGAVFACRRDYCPGDFAVKAIDLRRMGLSANAERQHTLLCREVEILRTLPPHRNLVRMVDAFEEGNWFLMVLERVRGGDLFEVLAARPAQRLLEAEAAHVARQVAEGLAFLHRLNIVHRDLKLENVLVASERRGRTPPAVLYEVKIADFGLSKEVGAGLSGAHSLVGTRPYTAPEVELRSSYGVSSDLWCLGILMYVMLAGRFPFERTPPKQAALQRIVDGVECGEAMKRVVSGLLQLDPARRLSLSRVCPAGGPEDGRKGPSPEREVKRRRAAGLPCSPRGGSQASGLAPGVVHHYVRTDSRRREQVLAQLLDALDFDQALVFVGSGQQAARLERLLSAGGLSQLTVHAGLDAALNEERWQRFADFEERVLVVAADLAAASGQAAAAAAPRLDLVVNFDAPTTPDQYLQRMGRGRRFATAGCAVTFVVSKSEMAVVQQIQSELNVGFSAMLAEAKSDGDKEA